MREREEKLRREREKQFENLEMEVDLKNRQIVEMQAQVEEAKECGERDAKVAKEEAKDRKSVVRERVFTIV